MLYEVITLAVFVLGEGLTAHQISFTGIQDDEGLKIEDPLQFLEGQVKKGADAARQRLEKPDVRHRASQIDVAKALATDLAGDDFNTALFADNATMLHVV